MINTGHLLAQLGQALATGQQHHDKATRERAEGRAARWAAVLAGVTSGSLRVGSRTPAAGLPAWVTLEVIRGGFATGNAAAGGPLQPHEVALLEELGAPRDGSERASLNVYYLGDEGRARLCAMLRAGTYRVQLPEEGALLAVAWLLDRGHAVEASALLEPLIPFLGQLRFYPIPAATPQEQGATVHLQTVGQIAEELRPRVSLAASGGRHGSIDTMNEAMRHWCPLSDRVVALWLATVEGEAPAVLLDEGKPRRRPDGNHAVTGGWPGAHFPDGWREQAQALLDEYSRLREEHTLSGKPERPRESFSRLRGYLTRALQGPALSRRDLAGIRALLAGIRARRGDPGSERLRKIRAAQEAQFTAPSFLSLTGVVHLRLSALPPDGALASLDAALAPVSASEATALGLTAGTPMPGHLRGKLLRCLDATVEELVAEGVISSGEVLARVLPQITAQVRSAGIEDPELRRLHAALYTAFRRRRSLLLMSLGGQVDLGELPWAAALDAFRERGLGPAQLARQTLEQVVTLALTSFPEEMLPNKLLQELRALVDSAGLSIPLVDELAADIFLGEFSDKFVDAARIAARMLQGTLYERYYGLPFDQILALQGSDAATRFASLCEQLAPRGTSDRWSSARNGVVIEQQQLLTTQNLAALLEALGLRAALTPLLPGLARRCFSWVCERLQRPAADRHARLRVQKNAAYAWRQMIFYLALCAPGEQATFASWAEAHFGQQDEAFRLGFRTAVEGLRQVIAGARFDHDGRLPDARRFLGWSLGPHWLG